jgi:mono/diheme cytochrome c family protein
MLHPGSRRLTIFAVIGLTAGGCTQIDNALAKVPVFAFMRESPFFDPYEHRNPLAADDPAALTLGQTMYERHCAVCHGPQGGGDGPLRGPGKFPVIPSLISGPATTRVDGYLYGIIRAGRGLMPAYGARMTHTERWSIVVYVNYLQARAGAPAAPAAAPAAVPGGAAPPDTAAAGGDTLQARR